MNTLNSRSTALEALKIGVGTVAGYLLGTFLIATAHGEPVEPPTIEISASSLLDTDAKTSVVLKPVEELHLEEDRDKTQDEIARFILVVAGGRIASSLSPKR